MTHEKMCAYLLLILMPFAGLLIADAIGIDVGGVLHFLGEGFVWID